MSRLMKLLLTMGLCFAGFASALGQASDQTTTARDRQSVNITVYNSNLGLVRETRRLTLPDGRIALRFSDVTSQIRPETVHLASLTSPSALRIQTRTVSIMSGAGLDHDPVSALTICIARHTGT